MPQSAKEDSVCANGENDTTVKAVPLGPSGDQDVQVSTTRAQSISAVNQWSEFEIPELIRSKSEPSPPKCGGLLDCSADQDPELVGITEVGSRLEPEAVGSTYSIPNRGPSGDSHFSLKRYKPQRRDFPSPEVHVDIDRHKVEDNSPNFEVSDITMPPWSINLVGFGDEYNCVHIDIPQNVSYSYVTLPKHIKAVSSQTTSALLRQIAGLTSIATNQSLKARDEILRMKRAYEASIKSKDGEISRLKREMVSCKVKDYIQHPFNLVGVPKQLRANAEIGKDKLDISKDGCRTGFSSSCNSSGDDDSVTDDFQSDEDGSCNEDVGVDNIWLPQRSIGVDSTRKRQSGMVNNGINSQQAYNSKKARRG